MSTTLDIGGEKFKFRRRRVTHKGWLEHYPFKKIDNEKFPEVKEGDSIVVNEIVSEEKETKPPARYNQASLIKELEKGNLELKLPVQILLISYMTENTYLEIKLRLISLVKT